MARGDQLVVVPRGTSRGYPLDLLFVAQGVNTQNVLPNTQWQVATAIGSSTKMNPQGTGTALPISVSSYTVGANTVVALTTNTGDLKVGDLVSFSAAADANLRLSYCRVDAVTPNVSFTVSLPLGLKTAASAACTATPVMAGGAASVGTGDAFDGWSKTTTLQVWREDNVVNLQPGSAYSAGLLKGAATPELMYCSLPAREVPRYLNRQVVFGTWCYQKIGTAGWRAFVTTNGTGGTTTYSSTAAAGSFAWAEVSVAVPADATTISFGVSLDGVANDVYYVSQPMAGFGTYLGRGNYQVPRNEYLVPKVKMSPLTFIGAAVTFPTVLDASGVTYGFAMRPYAETNGAVAPTVRALSMQLEGRTDGPLPAVGGAAGNVFATRNRNAVPHIYAVLFYATVAGAFGTGAGLITLNDGSDGLPAGDFFVYGVVSGGAWYQVSFDINGYLL